MPKAKIKQLWLIFVIFVILLLGYINWDLQIQNWNPQKSQNITFSSSNSIDRNFDIDQIQDIDAKIFIWPDTQNMIRFSDFIQSQDWIHGWIYLISDKNIKSTIKKLEIPIRIITEGSQYNSYQNTFKSLISFFASNENIKIVNDDKLWVNFNHTKTFFGNSRWLIQTANLSHTSYTMNKEHFVFGEDTWILASLWNIFNSDREGSQINSIQIHPNLMVCPIDCRIKIETLLDSASSSVLLYQQYITDPALQTIISNKINNWLNIQIAIPDSNIDNQKLVNLRWPSVVHLVKKPYIHSKSFLIDDKYLVIASTNFSTNSLDNNREIWIILTDTTNIQKWKKDFEKNFKK